MFILEITDAMRLWITEGIQGSDARRHYFHLEWKRY